MESSLEYLVNKDAGQLIPWAICTRMFVFWKNHTRHIWYLGQFVSSTKLLSKGCPTNVPVGIISMKFHIIFSFSQNGFYPWTDQPILTLTFVICKCF